MSDRRNVVVCGVPFVMEIIDGGVLFSNRAGFSGVAARFVWVFRSHLWYLESIEKTPPSDSVAGVHLVKMHKLLCEHIGGDHEQFELRFKETACDGK